MAKQEWPDFKKRTRVPDDPVRDIEDRTLILTTIPRQNRRPDRWRYRSSGAVGTTAG